MAKIDVNQLAYEIQHMNRHKKIDRVLREELTKVDHWKQQGRGDPVKAYSMRGKDAKF
jgi:protein associated with RNAse G/E